MAVGRKHEAENRLLEAIEKDNIAKFKEQLKIITKISGVVSESKLPVNLQIIDRPLIYLAAKRGSINIVRFLLENKVDITTADNSFDKENALSAVCIIDGSRKIDKKPERLAIAKLLLENKIDVNKGIGKEYTALHYAALAEFDEMVQLLLNNKAEVNAKDSLDRSPLSLLIKINKISSSASTVEILLKNGTNINLQGSSTTPWEDVCFCCPSLKPLLVQYMIPSPELSEYAREAQKLELLAASSGLYGNNIQDQVKRVQEIFLVSPTEEKPTRTLAATTLSKESKDAISVKSLIANNLSVAITKPAAVTPSKKDNFGDTLTGLKGAFTRRSK